MYMAQNEPRFLTLSRLLDDKKRYLFTLFRKHGVDIKKSIQISKKSYLLDIYRYIENCSNKLSLKNSSLKKYSQKHAQNYPQKIQKAAQSGFLWITLWLTYLRAVLRTGIKKSRTPKKIKGESARPLITSVNRFRNLVFTRKARGGNHALS